MKAFYIHLNVPAEKMCAYYRGELQFVQVVAESGETVRFPLRYLRPHLTTVGVQGRFRLEVDQHHRLRDIRPCPS